MDVSKQAIHQFLGRRMRESEESAYLLPIIADLRKDHPTLSCRAMYHKLKPGAMGRDAFESLCSRHGFTMERRRNGARTTDSSGVVRFDNLLKDKVLTGINQAFSSDITYFQVGDRFYYITFLMDCHSRRILGHATSRHLFTEHTTLPALEMAVKARGGKLPEGVIFHSDGGGQYYDKGFLARTKGLAMVNSMCEHAWENGKAERVNGTIKNNYLTFKDIKTFEGLGAEVDHAVTLYNKERPHKSLKYLTPLEYEKQPVLLSQQTKPKMTGSLDAKQI